MATAGMFDADAIVLDTAKDFRFRAGDHPLISHLIPPPRPTASAPLPEPLSHAHAPVNPTTAQIPTSGAPHPNISSRPPNVPTSHPSPAAPSAFWSTSAGIATIIACFFIVPMIGCSIIAGGARLAGISGGGSDAYLSTSDVSGGWKGDDGRILSLNESGRGYMSITGYPKDIQYLRWKMEGGRLFIQSYNPNSGEITSDWFGNSVSMPNGNTLNWGDTTMRRSGG